MHIYQKHILDLLRGSTTLRYSELQPDGVESSHFKYHLNQLIKEKLVSQISRGVYSLTDEGHSRVDRLSRGKVNPDQTPKVITYTLLKDDTYYYLQKKDKEPYRGLLNMIGGKLHQGESSEQATRREVHEKTGLTITHPVLAGTAEIIILHNDTLLTHAVAFIYVAHVDGSIDGQKLIPIRPIDLAITKDLAPDLPAIIHAVEKSPQPFALHLRCSY